jgi:hypothetical protein
MAFVYKKNLLGGERALVKVVLNASETFSVGDAVYPDADDGVSQATAGQPIFGIIASIITDKGVPPANDGNGSAFIDTYTTAASNETSAKVSALVDVSPYSLYSVNLDDTIATTTGSNKRWYMMDLPTSSDTSAELLDESSASATTGQFFSWGLDPDNSDRVLVNIRESFIRKADTS